MSTLKTTNLQNADASSANIILGQGSGGGATISGVTTVTTLKGGTEISSGTAVFSGIATATTFAPTEGQLGNRNVIINGAMEIAQRGTSDSNVSGSPAFTYHTVDRWVYGRNTSAVVTLSQAADAPTGFKYCHQLDVTTADASPSYCRFVHRVEGNNIIRFGFGKSGTRYATLSFWHKHTKTGTNHVCIQNYANDRSYVAPYTQSTTNTWEKAVITFPVDTSGTWVTTGAGGLLLQWPMCDDGAASSINTWLSGNAVAVNSTQVNNLDSTSNYFRITGVQLELGSAATPFEQRSYGDELRLCQRYYYHLVSGNDKLLGLGMNYGNPDFFAEVTFPVTMRVAPSLVITTGTNYYRMYQNNSSDDMNSFTISRANTSKCNLYDSGSGGSAGKGGMLVTNNASASVAFNAEL